MNESVTFAKKNIINIIIDDCRDKNVVVTKEFVLFFVSNEKKKKSFLTS